MKKNNDKYQTDDGDQVIGRISVHPAGYGFVAVEEGSDDVFVPAKYRGEAMDGDRVRLGTWDGYKGTEGRVIDILDRGRAKLTGVIEREKRGLHVTPDDPRVAADYGSITLEGGTGGGRQGQAVVVEISRYPTRARREIRGRVVRVLGDPDDPRTEIEKILACSDIPRVFPDGALAQAERTPEEVRADDLADRIDLRDRPFATIDPETARDFDDALCIEEGPQGGWRVWVAVADVSHYVRNDDALDREAAIRGVSVYLPDRVIPMLPFPLSAGICSLNPEVDRCAMVVRLDFDSKGKLIDKGFAAAVIRSHARLDYPGVAAALQGDFRGRRERYRPWRPSLMHLDDLAQKLRKRRLHRGALDLELSEAKVILDNDDPRLVRDIVRAKGSEDVKRAYQLVEEFMIAANEAVGSFFRERELPCVWRVHAAPRPQKVEELAAVLQSYGIHVDPDEAITPQGMKHVLAALGKRPEARPLTFLVLRSLKQAVYQLDNVGHFGLASQEYLHFTSPIRRYPDLLVHRLLKRQLHALGQASGGGGDFPDVTEGELAELAAAASTHERRAMEAEREAVSMYRAYLMREHVSEEFSARVSGVTNFGAFVELDEPFIEGLIKLEGLGDDYYAFDPASMRLTGRRSGHTLGLGDRVDVELTNVSVPLRRVDFRLLAGGGVAKKPRGKRERREVRPKPKGGDRRRTTTRTERRVGGKKSAAASKSSPKRTSKKKTRR